MVPSKPVTRRSGLARAVNLALRYRLVAELKPSPKNPRTHTPRQIDQIAQSIAKFGFNCPISIDAGDQVIAGHGRLEAAKQLGLERVPTIRLDHLSPHEAKAFLILDNRLAELASWDDALLGETFVELLDADLDFELPITGFDIADIDRLTVGVAATEPSDEDELPAASDVAVSQPGDLWLLGDHRILCGDALDPQSYTRLLDGEKAAIAVNDFPYNVPIEGHVGGKGRIHHREFAMAAGEMTDAEFRAFLGTACGHLVRHSVDGAIHYAFMDWRSSRILQEAADPHYSELKNICVWQKDSPGLGSFYRSQHELVFVYKVGKGPHQNNIELGRYGRNRSNVWTYAGANSFARKGEDGNLLAFHPTSKPVALIADILLDASSPNNIVLDAFAGAGATLIAAERTGRKARTIEIDGTYCDTGIRRWQKLTGRSAIHATLRCTFNELEEQGGRRG